MNLFSTDSSTSIATRIVQGVLSVLGVYAIIRFLPRIVSSVFKRFVIGIVGEILLVAGGTLLTEQWSRHSGTEAGTVRPRDASSRPDTR
ncbi:hypothetical protein [Longibacter sp.]|uniref:hypothetical protein n=1 Tax=Longibacter sp. TaxID=2045415 RepID=UPI003EBC02B1